MASYSTSWVVPAPLGHVLAAAVYAAPIAQMQVLSRTPSSVRCKSNLALGLLVSSYPVTVDLTAAELNGYTTVLVKAGCFGIGPLQTGNCRNKATDLLTAMSGILQSWAQQNAQSTPPNAPTA